MQIIRKNFTLKLLAIALAVVGWAYFRLAGAGIPVGESVQQISVPIAAVNLAAGYVAHYTDREAVVTVDVKRGDPPVKPDDVKAALDLSNKSAGLYNVPITLVAPALVVASLSPASVTLSIERIETRTIPVTVRYLGNQRSAVVVASAKVTPSTATIRGAVSALAQIATVQAGISLPSQAKAVDEMVRPVAVNAAGEEVTGLTVVPDLVRVRLDLSAGSAAKP